MSPVEISGELQMSESIRAMVLSAPGQFFRELMTLSEERIETVFGNSGYTFVGATGSLNWLKTVNPLSLSISSMLVVAYVRRWFLW